MLKKYLKISSVVALVLLLVGIIGATVTEGIRFALNPINSSNLNTSFISTEFSSSIPLQEELSFTPANIELNVRNMPIKVMPSSSANVEIILSSTQPLEEDFIITQSSDTIAITSPSRRQNFFTFWNYRKAEIVVKLPIDFNYQLYAGTSNGSITIEDISSNQLYAKTSNSSVTLTNIYTPKDITAKTSNGNMELTNLTANTIDASTSNSKMELTNLTANTVDATTSNGRINAKDLNTENKVYLKTSNATINMNDIYSDSFEAKSSNGSLNAFNIYGRNVDLKTSNASITYENDDMDYIIDNLYTKTSNGKESIRVNYKYSN